MKSGKERGAILVELALTFPILLLIIYFLLFFAYAMNARAQLASATFNGPLLAATRGNQAIYGSQALMSDLNISTSDPKFISIFKYPTTGINEPPDWDNTIMTQWAVYPEDYVGSQYTLDDASVPRIYPYALAYTYQQAKLGLGPGIRYACLPNKEAENAGCLNCRVILSQTEIDRFADSGYRSIYDPVPISISCVYQFPAFFSRPIGALLGLFGGGFEEVTTSVSTYSLGSTGGGDNGSITANDIGGGPMGGPMGGPGGAAGFADAMGAGFAEGDVGGIGANVADGM